VWVFRSAIAAKTSETGPNSDCPSGAFFANDPATKAGMRGATSIRYLNAAILNHEEQA